MIDDMHGLQLTGGTACLGRSARSRSELQATVEGAQVLFVWHEGFSDGRARSVANGTPVIVSRIGSLVQAIDNGITGLLAEPSDSTALAQRVRWPAEHPEAGASMGQDARRRDKERFRGTGHLAALRAVYNPGSRGWAVRHA